MVDGKSKMATKGSRKWLQVLINNNMEIINSELKRELSLETEEMISWLSPLKSEDYREYQDIDFMKKLGLMELAQKLPKFWPHGGPHWDALAKTNCGKRILIEAKSHIKELAVGSCQAINNNSIETIGHRLKELKEELCVKSEVNWSKHFYQYGNRLAHLNFLRNEGIEAYLVYICFINDSDVGGPHSKEHWEGALELMNAFLGLGKHKLSPFISHVFINVEQLFLID